MSAAVVISKQYAGPRWGLPRVWSTNGAGNVTQNRGRMALAFAECASANPGFGASTAVRLRSLTSTNADSIRRNWDEN